MKFLVSGANGFVGTNLRKFLEGRGHACLKLDVSDADYSWDELEKIPFAEFDCVVHLAGKAHDLKKVSSEQSYFDVNVGLTQRIFEAVREKVGKTDGSERRRMTFIYFSSCKSVERDTPYAKSKWAAEQYLLSALSASTSSSTSFLHLCILRPAPIHGPGNKGNLNLLWSVVKHGVPWPLAAFENKRPFTSIGNVCAAVEALASAPLASPSTFFICDDDFVSTNRIIELMAAARGARARLWRLPKGLMRLAAKVGDVLHLPLDTERIEKLTEDYHVDNSELKKALGWEKMPVRVEDGMMETFRGFADRLGAV